MHVDPYYRAQVALANVISYRSMNGTTDPVSASELNLWTDFYSAFWEAIFRAYVKREKAQDEETTKTIETGYMNALPGSKARLGISDYAKILAAIGDLYDDLKYSSPEKETIASPHECDLPFTWSLV